MMKTKEINEGYEIIAAETYNVMANDKEARIVLGKMETKYGAMFVTWESARHPADGETDYFWGHYFDDEQKARADYHRRLIEKYDA